MRTRKERYEENRKIRNKLRIARKKCKYCGCYILGRHKGWCKMLICNNLECKHGRNHHHVLGCDMVGCPCESFEELKGEDA